MKKLLILALLAGAGAYAWFATNTVPRPIVALQVRPGLTAGQPAELSFRYVWKGETPITQFDYEHEKLMHLVVVSQDFSSYAHVHPTLDPATGVFALKVNQPVTDPDNQDAPRAFPRPGRYHMFSEVKPQGHPFISMDTYDLDATGPATPPASIAAEPIDASGTIKKTIGAYQVSLRVSRGGLGKLRFVTLAFHIETAGAPVKDLENWLSMPGHAILLSRSGDRATDKVFRHIHAAMGDMEAGSTHAGSASSTDSAKRAAKFGPDLEFYLRDAEIPPPGLYKLWGQFKHRGAVLTFPFVIDL